MTIVDRWLLPDGVDELLPDTAIQVEQLRRQILDLYQRWGYDLVMPPLIEFTDSLLSGTGSDLDLLTFKLTDQITGRTMGVRADVTPQTARMDAHSFRRQGPNRLCYAASVLHTRQRNQLESRCPIQIGVELYGEAGLAADIEVINLMIETLRLAGIKQINLDLGHVGIYRSLIAAAQLTTQQEAELFEILQRKAVPELNQWTAGNLREQKLARWIGELVNLAGNDSVIQEARKLFAEAPVAVCQALDEVQAIVDVIARRAPDTQVYLDFCELRGYHYHTGVVFAAFMPGLGQAIGNGGRYDHVGEAFGRSRPATGFNMNLKALARISERHCVKLTGIYAPATDNDSVQAIVDQLRNEGHRVVMGFDGKVPDFDELQCDRKLVMLDDGYEIRPV